MDNLCHTLVGVAMGEAGLRKKPALATATLIIGANLPDVDALAYVFGGPLTALGFRRGWTHGILAVALWPLVLTGLMLCIGALVRRRRPDWKPPDGRGLLLLSFVSVLSHPLLDLLNTYGVRLLMPFSNRWFYGDTLFIVDPWVLAALLAGILLARRARRLASPRPFRPARIALAGVALYITGMFALGRMSAGPVVRTLEAGGTTIFRVMVAPVPLNPFQRQAVVEVRGGYTTAQVDWFTGVGADGRRHWGRGAATRVSGALYRLYVTVPESRAAAATPEGRTFLSWARFPLFERAGIDSADCPPAHVCLRDMRYYGQGWAEVAVPVSATLSSPPHLEIRSMR